MNYLRAILDEAILPCLESGDIEFVGIGKVGNWRSLCIRSGDKSVTVLTTSFEKAAEKIANISDLENEGWYQ